MAGQGRRGQVSFNTLSLGPHRLGIGGVPQPGNFWQGFPSGWLDNVTQSLACRPFWVVFWIAGTLENFKILALYFVDRYSVLLKPILNLGNVQGWVVSCPLSLGSNLDPSNPQYVLLYTRYAVSLYKKLCKDQEP